MWLGTSVFTKLTFFRISFRSRTHICKRLIRNFDVLKSIISSQIRIWVTVLSKHILRLRKLNLIIFPSNFDVWRICHNSTVKGSSKFWPKLYFWPNLHECLKIISGWKNIYIICLRTRWRFVRISQIYIELTDLRCHKHYHGDIVRFLPIFGQWHCWGNEAF